MIPNSESYVLLLSGNKTVRCFRRTLKALRFNAVGLFL